MTNCILLQRASLPLIQNLASQFDRLVCVALDILPRDLQPPDSRNSVSVAVVNALGLAAGTMTLAQVESAILEQTDAGGGSGGFKCALLLHSLTDVCLCTGKREALHFLRRLVGNLGTNWTIISVLHTPLHTERDIHFWKDFADLICAVETDSTSTSASSSFSSSAVGTGDGGSTAQSDPIRVRLHSAKKQAANFGSRGRSLGLGLGLADEKNSSTTSAHGSEGAKAKTSNSSIAYIGQDAHRAGLGAGAGAGAGGDNDDDYDDEDPDDDLDL